jgi:hypothetical protein
LVGDSFRPIADATTVWNSIHVRSCAFVCATSALLLGCGTPPAAYSHAQDKLFAAVPLLVLFNDDFQPCFRTVNGKPTRLSDRECYRFGQPHHIRGVAITGFEAGEFYRGWTRVPPAGAPTDDYLQFDGRTLASGAMKDARTKCSRKMGCTVYLDFIGRRTAVQGTYGNGGLSKNIVIVDRLLAARLLN